MSKKATYKLAQRIARTIRRQGFEAVTEGATVFVAMPRGIKRITARRASVGYRLTRVEHVTKSGELQRYLYSYPVATVNMHSHGRKIPSDLWLVKVEDGLYEDYAVIKDRGTKGIHLFPESDRRPPAMYRTFRAAVFAALDQL